MNVTVSGGFHNRQPITFRVFRRNAYGDLTLSKRQLMRVQNHMCGFSDCECGGYRGGNLEIAGISELEYKALIYTSEIEAGNAQ